MVDKILRLQIVFLFFITLLAFVAYYYQDSLSDNYLSITSKRGYSHAFLNSVSYVLLSMLAFVGHMTGPWIFIPFLAFALLFAFCYGKRKAWPDIFNMCWLLATGLCLSILFFPGTVGKGLLYLVKQQLPPLELMLLTPFFFIAFLAGTFRKSFVGGCTLIMRRIWHVVWKISFLKFINGQRKNPPQKIPTPPAMETAKKGPSISKMMKGTINETVKQSPIPKPKGYHDLVVLPVRNAPVREDRPDKSYFEKIIKRLEAKLQEFKIEGKIINVLKGPVVDTFELELGPGVKVSRLISVCEDLSLALYGIPLRIVYPMKGHSTVGVEVPRVPRELIYLEDVLEAREFKDSLYRLPLAMGKNAFGHTLVVDLASMPHMLIAGATGAGKSVFLNALLVSLLVKRSPDQMKLILIDPKKLELALYTKLPHLVMPVITERKQASSALRWACQEMERRYCILQEFGVRNVEGFNQKLKNADSNLIASISTFYPDNNYKLPYLVIVIDEFADLVLTRAGREIENNICRLAAKARAAGIHLVLATQRPSVDVVTGLIKSNFPTRVSFRVSSSVDSRTILNAQGAEKLLGKGDMLFKHGVDTLRVHSALVDENEIEELTGKLTQLSQDFDQEALDFLDSGKTSANFPSGIPTPSVETDQLVDTKYEQAVQVVLQQGTASASMLQRRLGVGYNRAANLIEMMEEKGVVGPVQGSKPRKVLVSSADLT